MSVSVQSASSASVVAPVNGGGRAVGAPNTHERIEWIDIGKGVGIVLVTFGHLRNGDGQSVWLPALDSLIAAIYLFHMPLFYLLGGLTFSMRSGFKAFLKRKIHTLLVPYYVFSLYFVAKPVAVLLIPSMRDTFQTSHDYGLAHQFIDVLIMGNGLWFLMAFFVAEIIMYALAVVTHRNGVALSVIGVALIIVSYLFDDSVASVLIPFQLWRGLGIAGFMAVGVVLRSWFVTLNRRAGVMLGVPCCVALVVVACVLLSPLVFGGWAWVLKALAAVSGAFAFTLLCIAIARCGWLAYIGRFSLVFYALNALTLNVAKLLFFRVLHLDLTGCGFAIQGGGGLLVAAFALALLWVENVFVQKYMPWAVGK